MSPHPRITAVLSACAVVLGAAVLMTSCGSSGNGTGAQATTPVMKDSTGTVGSRTNLRLGFVTTVQHPYGLALAAFARRVTALSNGKVGVSLTAAYGGGDDLALLTEIRSGAIDGGSVSASVWQGVGVQSFEALQMPFLITNYAVERSVITSPLAAEMLKGTQALGLTGLAIHEGGLRKPAAVDGCLVEPPDFVGVQMRSVQSDLLAQSITALGAVPTAMPLSEVAHAVEDGSLNAIEANVGLVYTQKFYEVLSCMSGNVNLWPFPAVLVVGDAAWNAIPAADRAVITQAAGSLAADSLDILTDPASTLMADLCKAGDGFFYFGTATTPQLAALREAVQPVYDRYEKVDPTGGFVSRIEAIKARTAQPASAPYPPGCAA
jgi:TRAP-type C4-dicarboxylate transport system substrate-binding protein